MSSCGCNENQGKDKQNIESGSSNKVVNIDFLFLDLSVCTRCQGTEGSLDDALESTSELLKNIGYEVKVNKIHIETEAQAKEQRFESSPTIRVDGRDIQMEVKESHCSACSSLTDGASVDCRLWLYKGKEYSAPPKEMIIDAVMSSIYSNKNAIDTVDINGEEGFVLSDNLVEYFAKKDKLCTAVNKLPASGDCGCQESNCC